MLHKVWCVGRREFRLYQVVNGLVWIWAPFIRTKTSVSSNSLKHFKPSSFEDSWNRFCLTKDQYSNQNWTFSRRKLERSRSSFYGKSKACFASSLKGWLTYAAELYVGKRNSQSVKLEKWIFATMLINQRQRIGAKLLWTVGINHFFSLVRYLSLSFSSVAGNWFWRIEGLLIPILIQM